MHSQRSGGSEDQRNGGRRLARGGLDVRPIPGSHLTLMVEPLVRSTTRAIHDALPTDAEPPREVVPPA
jgi:hypothetical protein